ncbi:class F sortase [Jeotgalibacillus aurantiacus]|uniref:class F sortase n=1 Tax=Jeotgalibacillus aurantiacus TaxID=2763266 RepID=UPI001D0BD155|nr:class F sortase [Jeotgalibacillus aurantiacus]
MKIKALLIGLIFLLSACSAGDQPFSAEPETAPAAESETESTAVQEEQEQNENRIQVSDAPNPFLAAQQQTITPSRLVIPAINVDAVINPYGLDPESGGMAVPDNGEEVAWYEPGYKPGQKGNAVLAGHVDSEKAPAVFWDLKELTEGDEIHVYDESGKMLTYVVTKTEIYDRNEAPIQEIFGVSSKEKLNLITCTGYFDRDIRNYVDRMVVYTELKSDSAA